ncbi:uncharacterized protein [Antedon mediterranea]|uniref:uncharacterized protein n=1 Tax=Antedon mediterranea TaxID=105859 RepID=UPI003AF9F4E6
MVGGNITVINSVEEYNQLKENILQVLSVRSRSKFNVHVESELRQKKLKKGCAIIDVDDGTLSNTVNSENMNCSTTDRINNIICESTELTPGICQLTTETTTSRLDLTTTSSATVSNANSFTNTPNNLLETTPWYELDKCHGLVVDIITVSSAVIITIVVMCSLIFLRNKLKTSGRNHSRDSEVDSKSLNQDTHQNELYQLISQKHGAAVPSIDQSTLYHDTVVPSVNSKKTDSKSLNQDTHQNELYQLISQKHGAAVPSTDQSTLYHDIIVPAKSEQCVDDPNISYIELINN